MSAHLTGGDLEAYEREWKTKGHTIFKAEIPKQRKALPALRFHTPPKRTFAECQAACEHLNAENSKGGEARAAVFTVGKTLGIDLTLAPKEGQTWGEANMNRVLVAARQYKADHQAMTTVIAALRDDKRALREELTKAKGDSAKLRAKLAVVHATVTQ